MELDERSIEAMSRRLASSPRARIDGRALWSAFAEAFPARPQGEGERQLFVAALDELARRSVIELPSSRGHRWDRTHAVAVPSSVDLVRPRPAAAARAWRSFPWHPRLAFVAALAHLPPEHEAFLHRVHEGLVDGWFATPAPLKYRSLQLAGHEKRLGELLATRLFGPGRLDLALLGCAPEILPLAWERVGDAPRALIFENAGPFMIARAILGDLPAAPYGLVAFGDGARIEASLRYLSCIDFRCEAIEYVGDLDREGLRIALAARRASSAAGLPTVEPATGLHRAMLDAANHLGHSEGWPAAGERALTEGDEALVEFLPAELHPKVRALLGARRRIPEEVLGPERLVALWSDGARSAG